MTPTQSRLLTWPKRLGQEIVYLPRDVTTETAGAKSLPEVASGRGRRKVIPWHRRKHKRSELPGKAFSESLKHTVRS